MAAKYDTLTVRPIDRALGAFPDAKRKQGYWAARCRSHEDKRASLSIRETADGKVTVKCFAGCSKDDALGAVGLTWRDLLPPTVNSRDTSRTAARSESAGAAIEPSAMVAPAVAEPTEPIPASAPQPERVLSPIATIATIADAKGLPVEFLAAEGLEPRTGVEIVYRNAEGRPVGRHVRERVGDRFRWRSDQPVIPYGLDTLDAARERGSLWVVPTELDVWHLRRVEQFGIAVTEPAALDRLEAGHLAGVGELLVAAEPGEVGDRFRRQVAARAAALDYTGKVLAVRLHEDLASVADLAGRVSDSDQLGGLLRRAARVARPIKLSNLTPGREQHEETAPAPDTDRSPTPDRRRYATIARLSQETGLSPEYLRDQGVRSRYGVDIPYFDEHGNRLGTKTRTRLVAKEGSFWEAGKPLVPYGLEHLDEAKADGVLFVPEGESDVWTARYHGFAALGIPGASATRCIERRHLDGVSEVFAFVEPDTGGANFLPGLRERLDQIGYEGTIYAVRMPEATKDLSALHTASASREEFRERLVALLDAAEEIRVRASEPERQVEPTFSREWLGAQPAAVRAEFVPLADFGPRYDMYRRRVYENDDYTYDRNLVVTSEEITAAYQSFLERGHDYFTTEDHFDRKYKIYVSHDFEYDAWANGEREDGRRSHRLRALRGALRLGLLATTADARADVEPPPPLAAADRERSGQTTSPERTPAPAIRPEQWDESRAERPVERDRAAKTTSRVRRALSRVLEAGRRRLGRLRESVRERMIAALGAIDPGNTAPSPTDEPRAERARTSSSRREPAELRGTAKQVAWAEQIRTELARRLDEHLKLTLDHTRNRAPRERLLRTRRHLHDWLGCKTEAAWFINNRALTGSELVARAASEDPTVAKRLSGIAELARAARETREAERDRERHERLTAERERLTRGLAEYLAGARRTTLPVLHVHIDAVELAALDYLEREERLAFYLAHRDRSPRELLTAMRRSDPGVRSAVERYRRATADIDAHTVSPAVRSAARDELPTLRGDAECVALARRLRAEALERASDYLDAQYLAVPAEDRERLRAAGSKLVATLEREARAEAWIETRDLDGAALVERAARLRPDLRAAVDAFPDSRQRGERSEPRRDRLADRAPERPRVALGVS